MLFRRSTSSHSIGYPLQLLFVPFPCVSFVLALLTDIAFWATGNLMWQNFSAWLLLTGLVFGGLSIPFALIDLFRPSTSLLRAGLMASVTYVMALALAVINSLVHAGDGWTAVVPYGLVLSATTVVFILMSVSLNSKARRI
jgi:uncharacterized membrane protein